MTSFSFSRLSQLIRKQWFENARLYLYSTLALLGMLGLVVFFWLISDGKNYAEDGLYIIFLIGIFIAGAVFASMSFSMLGNKERGTYWLAFPASHLEKLVCMIFYNLIVFTIVYCVCFFFIKWMAVSYIETMVARHPDLYSFRRSVWDSNRSFLGILPYFLYAFVAVQAFYLMGSVYFPRYSFVITTMIGSALIFIFSYYSIELIQGSFNGGYQWNGDHIRRYLEGYRSYERYDMSPVLRDAVVFGARYLWAPVFWLIAWFRLKEKQI